MKQTTLSIDQDLASYVNTNIGTLSYKTWSTSPTVQLPHGMMEINPVTTPGIGDKYLADKIFGFSFGPAAVMISNSRLFDQQEAHASAFDHDQEETRPYVYRILLEDFNIDAEMTVAQHSAYFRFHSTESAHLTIEGNDRTKFYHNDGRIIEGERTEKGYVCYFSIEMKEAASSFGIVGNKLYLSYESRQEEAVELKVGISYISLDQARSNRQLELPDWNFDAAVSRAHEAWNTALSAIEVEGGTEEQRTIFYTAMYRTLQRMRNITEDGKYYSGFDGNVHDAEGRDFYTSDQLWDTYRCARPLQSIIEPRVFEDMVFSLVRMYEQGGLLPKFPHPGGDHAVMIGHHAASLIADACMKGLDDIHLEKAYEGMIKDAAEMSMIPWRTVPATELDRVYREQGWFPALPVREDAKVPDPDEWRKKNNIWDLVMEKMPNQITWVPDVGVDEWIPEVDIWHRRQSVSVTLERAYDDWCIAQVARKLGRDEEADEYIRRAGNYRHLFRSDLGLMAPKTAEGEWVEPFDPKLSGGFAGEGYFAEVNAWIYTFHVQHDVEGLIRLMGGREAFISKLDSLFTEQYTMEKPWFLGQFPDMSGLIGMYAHGNEPSFHIPYMYNYAGAPWKTQRRVRDIQSLMYNAGPAGLCGDDDIGSLSSWYVFSAMGFYPVCPGRPVYDIGSPLFEKTTLRVDEGKAFVIEARNVSKANKYIQSAVLNGQPHQRPWLSHQELMSEGQLVLEMGPRPNKAWGSSPEDVPPSMTAI